MTAKVGLLQITFRRPLERKVTIWLLWAIALVCVSLWSHGLVRALTVSSNEHVPVLSLASWEDLSRAMLHNPFQALPRIVGRSRAHQLESWASSSFSLGLIAETALILSLYLRKKGW